MSKRLDEFRDRFFSTQHFIPLPKASRRENIGFVLVVGSVRRNNWTVEWGDMGDANPSDFLAPVKFKSAGSIGVATNQCHFSTEDITAFVRAKCGLRESNISVALFESALEQLGWRRPCRSVVEANNINYEFVA